MRLLLRFAAILIGLATAPAMAEQSPVYIVIDIGAGTVLDQDGAERLWHPASITKIMTAYVTFRAIKAGEVTLESPVVVSKNALKEPPSKMGYRVGTEMTLNNALKMLIVRSANDIAVAIAESVGGSEPNFIARMNAEAQRLGMPSTRYHNPNGLPDEGQVTTARDMAVLTRALWLEFPQYRDYFKIPAIRVGKKTLRSHNTLLEHFPGTNGMKTGFICASGFNMVATATRSGRTLAVVVLGANSSKGRAEIAASLLQDGFKPKLFRNKRNLATYRNSRSPGPAANIRDEICGKKKKKDQTASNGKSALVPRFVLMDPVRVRTGLASNANGSSGSSPARGIPIPRPRPPMPGENAAILPASPNRAEISYSWSWVDGEKSSPAQFR